MSVKNSISTRKNLFKHPYFYVPNGALSFNIKGDRSSIQQQLKHSLMHSKVCMCFLVKYKIDFENWIFAIFKDQKKFLIKYLL